MQTKRLEQLQIYLRSSEFPEDLKTISLNVQVFDINKKTQTVYFSISEAARSIGCTKSAISVALKIKREKGVNKLIKKRYIVTPKTEESKVIDSSLPHGSML